MRSASTPLGGEFSASSGVLAENSGHSDKASGYLYGLACDLHCPRPDELNADDPKVLPLPLIFHIDKSHKSLKGDLAVTPVGMTLGQLDVDTIQRTDAWRMVAVVPNLKARQGSAKKSSTDDENRVKLQDQHDIFRVALSSLKEVYDQGGITWYNQKGELVILKPFVYMIIGDTVGNNELCKHFGGNNGQCLLKDCKCKLDNLVDTPTLCKPPTYEMLKGCDGNANKIFDTYEERGLISLRDLSDLNKNRQSEKAISYYDIRGFDDGLPLADPYQGIIGITPQELLHVTENGDMEYILLAHRNVIGKKAANASVKEKINAMPPALTWRASLFGAVASTAAYSESDEWLDGVLITLNENRHLVKKLIDTKIPTIKYRIPDFGYLAWLDVSSLGLGSDPAGQILERSKLALNAGVLYGPKHSNFVRFNFGTSEEIINQAFDRLVKIL